MNEQILQQYGLGALAIIIGLSGWLLPFEWNFLKLKKGWRDKLSEETNKRIPKILGSILIILGLVIVVGTLSVGVF